MFKVLIISMFLVVNVYAKRETITEAEKSELLNLYQTNESLFMAFFKYDGKSIESQAKIVSETISKMKSEKFKSKFNLAKKMLARLKASADKEANIKSYHTFSMALVNILDHYDLGKTYNVYYCPMLKMKWVQNSKKREEVHNPYADYMPHCGRKYSDY